MFLKSLPLSCRSYDITRKKKDMGKKGMAGGILLLLTLFLSFVVIPSLVSASTQKVKRAYVAIMKFPFPLCGHRAWFHERREYSSGDAEGSLRRRCHALSGSGHIGCRRRGHWSIHFLLMGLMNLFAHRPFVVRLKSLQINTQFLRRSLEFPSSSVMVPYWVGPLFPNVLRLTP